MSDAGQPGGGSAPHVDQDASDSRVIRSGIPALMVNWAWKSALVVGPLGLAALLAEGFLRGVLALVFLVVLAGVLFQILNLAWTRHQLVHPERLARPEVVAALSKLFLAAGNVEASAAAERFAVRRT